MEALAIGRRETRSSRQKRAVLPSQQMQHEAKKKKTAKARGHRCVRAKRQNASTRNRDRRGYGLSGPRMYEYRTVKKRVPTVMACQN